MKWPRKGRLNCTTYLRRSVDKFFHSFFGIRSYYGSVSIRQCARMHIDQKSSIPSLSIILLVCWDVNVRYFICYLLGTYCNCFENLWTEFMLGTSSCNLNFTTHIYIHYDLVIFALEVFVFVIFGVLIHGPPSQFSIYTH